MLSALHSDEKDPDRVADPESRFTCVSWNIHRGRGNDGVVDPARTARVLRDEVWSRRP